MTGTVLLFLFGIRTVCSYMYQFPGFIEVPIGGDIFLNCNTMGASLCDRISWYKVSRTGQMKNVTAVLGNKSPTDCTLTIPNATPKDSGTYYCSGSYSVLSYIGNGSIVITIDPNAKPSSITTYISDINALSDETEEPLVISLQCVVMGVGTSQARVFWMIEEKERTGWTESNWANGSDSFTPFIRAHASVSAEEWTIASEIKCVVEFNGMIISKSLQIYDSTSICSLLMYVGSAVAFLIIAVTVIIVFKRNLERTLWSLICARKR
ncbi:uncharacterized protein [Misgurnus anguillicaudatus]|uniref:uncharacterized protein isoform X1 n=2 Tax=Misgurnus anguillicaudatus TaxID=75329 RepID=UPI003CCF5CAB